MFKCEVCQKSSEPHEKGVRVVVETREAVYPYGVHPNGDKDPGGKGLQIAKEILAHNRCVAGALNTLE